jgi:hypothetical protein
MTLPFPKLSLILVFACVAGCATTVRPPADPKDPVVVVLVDYAHHSALILPDRDGGWMEHAYGEWDYFALNKTGLCAGMIALCCPNQGTLGRRKHPKMDVRDLRDGVRAEETFALTVARERAESLARRLDERFRGRSETQVFNPEHQLTFVKDDDAYICWHNCNHAVAAWLEELGCDVSGWACFSDFRVEPPER